MWPCSVSCEVWNLLPHLLNLSWLYELLWPMNGMQWKRWCTSSEPESQEFLGVLPVFLCLCHYQENMAQLIFQRMKYKSLRTKSCSQNHPRSANSSWPPGIGWAQSKLEETIQLNGAVSWMASSVSGMYALVKTFFWLWAGPSDVFLINRIQQCDEMSLPRLCYKRPISVLLILLLLSCNPCSGGSKLLCFVRSPMEKST